MILGASGALGGYLSRALADRFQLACPRSEQFSVRDQESIDALLFEHHPLAVINCIAVTPKSRRAAAGDSMREVNGRFPHRLARAAQATGCYLVHISTDGVFSGAKGHYREIDTPDPQDEYGRTKLLGEINGPGAITLRTTFYGSNPNKAGLVDWFLQQRGCSVRAYKNYRFSGLWLGMLARAIESLLLMESRPEGVLHCGGEAVSKYELLLQLRNKLSLAIDIEACGEPVCDRTLDSTRFWQALGEETPTQSDMLAGLAYELGQSEQLRSSRRRASSST